MKFSLLSENINSKISTVSHAISNRSQLTILLNFLIVAKGGELLISATDLEIGIISKIPANIEEEGEVTVPARTFLELISNIPSGKVSFYTEKDSLFIESAKTKTQLQTQDPKEFPALYEKKGEELINFDKEWLDKKLKRTVFAASIDASRPVLTGILIKEDKEGKTVVATDGYRLSLERIKAKSTEIKESSIIIPSRVIKELMTLKESGDIKVYVSPENNQAVFAQGDTEVVGRLIEANFPEYEKIIPKDTSTTAVFSRAQMQNAVKTCWVFAKETSGIIRFAVGDGKITVSSSTPSVGHADIDVEAKIDGEGNEIAFNGRYLIELFSAIDDDEVVFEMTGPLNAGVFKISGDNNFLHLIMPIRVQE